jgi:hypothetical protein
MKAIFDTEKMMWNLYNDKGEIYNYLDLHSTRNLIEKEMREGRL